MKVFGIAGWSGSGKTTLIRKLIPALVGRGLRVSTLKHAHHSFDIDTPGKDSYEHRHAGASEVMITSAARWALMHELRDEPEPSVEDLIERMAPVDLLLIEGFKHETYDKLEVHRPSVGKPLLCSEDSQIVALASDTPMDGLVVPTLNLDDIEGITGFIVTHCGLDAALRNQG